MGRFLSLALACGLVVAVCGGPIPKYAYQDNDEYWKSGNQYQYSYTANVQGLADGSTDHTTGVQIKCDVNLLVIGNYRYILETRNCELSEIPSPGTSQSYQKHPRSNEFNVEMSSHPVRFAMSHGTVHGISADATEAKYTLNIKRGIISALQGARRGLNADGSGLRTDVHGTCPVTYEVHDDEVKITKAMNKCQHPSRSSWELSPSSLVWNMSFVQLFLLNSASVCTHKLNSDSLQSSTCAEHHAIRLDLATKKAHAQTVNTQTLVLTGSKKGAGDLVGFDVSDSIVFEWEPEPEPTQQPNFEARANKLVADFVTTNHEEVRAFTNEQFYHIVKLLRQEVDVLPFTQGVYECRFKSSCDEMDNELARAYVRDALVTCNTVPCVKAVSWLATHNHLSKNYLNLLLFKWTKLKVDKPGYLDAIAEICIANPTRTCLLSVSSIMHTYALRNPGHIPSSGVKSIANLLTDMIGSRCTPETSSAESDADRVESYILALKSIGNLGDIAFKNSRSLLSRLQGCIENSNLPHNVSLEAIKAFRRVGANDQVFSILFKILRNPQQSMEHRAVAYLVLSNYNYRKLYDELAKVIPGETNDQLGNFVSMHMKNVLLYADASLENLKQTVRLAFNDHEDVFVVKGVRPLSGSRHREKARYARVPFLHDIINEFGYDISSSAIHEAFTYLPQHLILNLTTQLFGKTFNPLTLSTALHGLEPYLEYFLGQKLDDSAKSFGERFKKFQERQDDFADFMRESSYKPHFEDKVERRLTEIHNSAVQDYAKQAPSGTFSLKLYGDELAYTSLGLIKARIESLFSEDLIQIQWDQKHHYRAHRFIRFIEGYNQIPTMSGLPLKWKTSANLAISLRIGVQADLTSLLQTPPSLNAEWDLKPSGALTIVNKMSVSVPKFTKFGVRSNTTFYRSRERGGSFEYVDGELDLKIKVSSHPQQLINIFRVNQLIRGDQLEEIADHNIKRVQTENCLPDQFTGLKYCRYKSYASVANRNVWDILASNAEYRVWYELADPGLKQYNFHVKRTSPAEGPEKAYEFSFSAPGDKWRREINGKYMRNPETKEFNIQVSVPEKPNFKLSASRLKKVAGGQVVGYVTDVDLKLIEGRPLELHGETTISKKQRPDSKGKSVEAEVKDTKATLKLKDRTYTWHRVHQAFSDDLQINHHITYESSNSRSIMHQILPDIFWESPSKASLRFHTIVHKDPLPEGFERTSSSYIQLPKSILQLNTERIENPKVRRALHFNITRRHLPSYEIQSYLNATYDMWNTETGDKTHRDHIVKLLLPHVRWVFSINRDIDPVDNKNLVVFKREKATDGSLELTSSTPVDSWEVELEINHHNDSRARGDNYPAPRERHLDIILRYPRDGTKQVLSYKGKIVNDEGVKNAIKSFHTDSHIETSFWQLKLHGKSSYLRNNEKINFDHHSDITNLRTGKTATYDVHLAYDYKLPLEFTQNFVSSFYTFKESFNVRRVDFNVFDGSLEIHANAPELDVLNVDLIQTFHIDPDDSWEKMEFRHKYFDIDVKAEFKLPFGRYYKKEFNIKSKNTIFPSMKWILNHHDYIYYSARIEYPDEHRSIDAVLELDQKYKGAGLLITHEREGQPKENIASYAIAIAKPDVVVTNSSTNPKVIRELAAIYVERFRKLWEAWVKIKTDPEHPLNKFLRPIVKTTIADYLEEQRERIRQRHLAVRAAIVEAIRSLEPIYGPTLTVIKNILVLLEKATLVAIRESEDQRSYIALVWDRMEVKEKLRAYVDKLGERLTTRLNSLMSKSRSGSTAIHHPFRWTSLRSVPEPTPKLARLIRFIKERALREQALASREAVIFGKNNVYTFDGRSYKLPHFAGKDCSFLLAHNFVARKYSVLAQEDAYHLLYPDVAVTVEKKDGAVRINNQPGAANLPVEKDHVKVYKDGNKIVVASEWGVCLTYDPTTSVAVFHTNFWNHGKTLGLLGNNDNEIRNDFKKLDGSVTNDLAEFLTPYELSGQATCTDRRHLSTKQNCKKTADPLCYSAFHVSNIWSPLYPCFDIVNSVSFLEACIADTECGGNAHSAIAAYAEMCDSNGVPITLSNA